MKIWTMQKRLKRFVIGSATAKDARDAEPKRVVQKRENHILDMLPEFNMPFQELSDWYTSLKTLKIQASYERLTIALNTFNAVFDNRIAGTILPIELEDFQEKRLEDELAATPMSIINSLNERYPWPVILYF
jgi:hypothetical protein